eukprot:scaffold9680_cov47-Attheya_sp.AAC.3
MHPIDPNRMLPFYHVGPIFEFVTAATAPPLFLFCLTAVRFLTVAPGRCTWELVQYKTRPKSSVLSSSLVCPKNDVSATRSTHDDAATMHNDSYNDDIDDATTIDSFGMSDLGSLDDVRNV